MIRVLGISYTDKEPMRPADAQFGVKIDFMRGQSDPVQVFAAMTDLLRGFAEIDRQLIGAIAPEATPTTVIEDIEAASITAWVRSALNRADDKAIESMDVKKAIGVYLVKAKYRIIEFLDDKEEQDTVRRREMLLSDLSALAADAPSSTIFPAQIDLPALEKPMNDIQEGKARLSAGEVLTVKAEGEPDHPVNTGSSSQVRLAPPTAPAAPINDGGFAQMILLIRKPDLIGKSKWEFKHGKQTVSALVGDADWMARFHRGEIRNIVPGAEMLAKVHLTYQRDASGTISGVEHEVAEVLNIIPPTPSKQAALFSDDEGQGHPT